MKQKLKILMQIPYSSQKVEQVTYFKFYYKVSASKVTNDQGKSVTKCKCDASRQSRSFWHHPWDACSPL